MFQAFDRGEEFNTQDIKDAIHKTYPLSKTMGEMIKHLREWAKNRAVSASTEECELIEEPNQKNYRVCDRNIRIRLLIPAIKWSNSLKIQVFYYESDMIRIRSIF